MAGHSFVLFGWSWTEVSLLGSQVFGQDLVKSCDVGAKEILILAYCGFCLAA